MEIFFAFGEKGSLRPKRYSYYIFICFICQPQN